MNLKKRIEDLEKQVGKPKEDIWGKCYDYRMSMMYETTGYGEDWQTWAEDYIKANGTREEFIAERINRPVYQPVMRRV